MMERKNVKKLLDIKVDRVMLLQLGSMIPRPR